MRARVDGREVLIGNAALIESNGISIDEIRGELDAVAKRGETPVVVTVNGVVEGVIAVADEVRAESNQAIRQLMQMGIQVVMLTGDNEYTANAIAKKVGVDKVVAGVLPSGKAAEVKRLRGSGEIVAMVGDGINDAPALAEADVGIAIGTGTDVAIEASDMTLLRGDLRRVVTAIALSRATMATVKQNLFWAFIYNVIGIPIAAGILYPVTGWLLSPVLASAAMSLSSVSVLTNSLRLRAFRGPAL
jgi:Cu+-exporting ATPase